MRQLLALFLIIAVGVVTISSLALFVTFNVASYLLTSEGAVQTAAAAGDVTVTRMPMKDFKCPIQP